MILSVTAGEQFHYPGLDRGQTVVVKARADGDDNVTGRGEPLAVQPEDFPHQSLNPVAANRVAGLPVQADPKSTAIPVGRQKNQCASIPPRSSPMPVDVLKFRGRPEQIPFGKRVPAHPRQAASCLRPLALLRLMTA